MFLLFLETDKYILNYNRCTEFHIFLAYDTDYKIIFYKMSTDSNCSSHYVSPVGFLGSTNNQKDNYHNFQARRNFCGS